MTEAELKARVVEYAHLRGWRVYSQPMVNPKRPVKQASGYPDLTLARGKQVYWIELKQEDGLLSHDQMLWMLDLPWCHVIRPSDWEEGRVQRMLA